MTEQDVFSALDAESHEFYEMVSALDDDGWATPTPAPGWTVAHQVAHLAFVAKIAGLAASDAETFAKVAASAGADFDAAVAGGMRQYLELPPKALLEAWSEEQKAANRALAAVPAGRLVPWLVNPLPSSVLASAGMMELFAHGQDVADALGVRREPTARLQYLAGFGARTVAFGYLAHGLTPPQEEFRFELTGPSGESWEFGPADAENRVTGSALDFCLLVARRRHPDDLDVTATGEEAVRWLPIAQAYRGPAGEGRKAGQFAPAG